MTEKDSNISLEYLRKQNEKLREFSNEHLKSGDGGGTYGGMEARVAKLEATVSHIERDVGELRVDMKDVRDRLKSIETSMATKGFVFSVYGIVSVLLAAIILFQTQIQQLVGTIPK
ncbi:hypothetical protein [Phyllobacterium sp. YR531]|uniref:hypothetical protein n=1 Tax=Phyllobacterium sp. YR531 TaxID=1144343 RepID=UPI00026FBAF0|nr:hypothetical protein [Phyllobacterium sp. YR531]EJN04276.1 hypothetical protein PMI41_01915 [Phyllobacterium sp. YR531]